MRYYTSNYQDCNKIDTSPYIYYTEYMKHRRSDWETFRLLSFVSQLIIIATITAIFLAGYVVGVLL